MITKGRLLHFLTLDESCILLYWFTLSLGWWLVSQLNGMQEAAKNKREADANRARLEAEITKTESTVEDDLNTERRKKLQEKQRVRKQVEDEIAELSKELFSKKVRD